MRKASIIGVIWLLVPVCIRAEEKTVIYEGLIRADPLPKGYQLSRREVTQGPYKVHFLELLRPGAAANGSVLIGSLGATTDEDRVKFIRSDVGAMSKGFERLGWKVISNDSPDIAKADLSQPYVASLVLENKDGKKRYLWNRVFFASTPAIPYHVAVVAENERELKTLSKWGESVREK
jgi:hypothetical protein